MDVSERAPSPQRPGPPAKRVAAGVLISDEVGRVLLIQPAYERFWQLPGGTVEHDESPRHAALRGLGESLGMALPLGVLLAVDWFAADGLDPDALMLVYEGGLLSDARAGAIRLPPGEINAYGFVDLEGAQGLVSTHLERRIWAALRARRLGRPVELEDGRLVEIDRAMEPASSA